MRSIVLERSYARVAADYKGIIAVLFFLFSDDASGITFAETIASPSGDSDMRDDSEISIEPRKETCRGI